MHTCTTTVSPICTANGMRCTTHASAWERGGKAKKNKTVGDDMTSIQRQVIPQCTHTRAHTHTHTHKTHTHTHTHTQDTHKTHTRHKDVPRSCPQHPAHQRGERTSCPSAQSFRSDNAKRQRPSGERERKRWCVQDSHAHNNDITTNINNNMNTPRRTSCVED